MAYSIEPFVSLVEPGSLAVDSLGNLYTGNGSPNGAFRARFISADGSEVREIGDPLNDPDNVLVDDNGYVGNAGDVLIGAPSSLYGINPDSDATDLLFSGAPLANVGQMAFDSTGRLFLGQVSEGAGIAVIDNGSMSLFASRPGERTAGIAIDDQDNLFVSTTWTGLIYKLDATGVFTDEPFATLPGTINTITFIDEGPMAGDLFAAGFESGNVYLVDGETGDSSIFVSGLQRANQIVVAPSGDMFVTDNVANMIYRITPEPSALSLMILASVLLPTRRLGR